MPISNGYCTEQQVRDQFDDSGSALPQALIERAVNATSRAIDKFCGRRFWLDSAVQTLTFGTEFDDLAWIDDVGTTTGLVVATDDTGDGTYGTTWTEGTDFRLEPRNADKHGAAHAWWRLQAIGTKRFPVPGDAAIDPLQVTAKFGWSAVPDEVEQACILRAAAIFKRKESISGVAGFDGFGVVRISRRRDPDVAELLDNFIRMDARSV